MKKTSHYKRLFPVFIITLTCFLLWGSQEGNASEKDELLANFIYNLVDYINWEGKTDINICTYGYDQISDRLSHIKESEADRLSGIVKVTVNPNIAFNQVMSCDLLYVAQNEKKDVLLLLEKTKRAPIITVSAMENFTIMGGIMEFKIVRRKVQLKVNQEALSYTGITLSPVILRSVRPTISPSNSSR